MVYILLAGFLILFVAASFAAFILFGYFWVHVPTNTHVRLSRVKYVEEA